MQLRNFQKGKPEGYGKNGGRPTQEQIQALIKSRGVRISSVDNDKLGMKSPFMKKPNLPDYMKANLVNNAIFHSQFDATIVEKDNLDMAKQLLGNEPATRIGLPEESFDKRYY